MFINQTLDFLPFLTQLLSRDPILPFWPRIFSTDLVFKLATSPHPPNVAWEVVVVVVVMMMREEEKEEEEEEEEEDFWEATSQS